MPHLPLPDGELYFETYGEAGPWVVFVHGGGGNCMTWWQQVPAFGGAHRVLLMDLPNFGRSTGFPTAFDPAAVAAYVLALLSSLEIGRAALVCHSLGGWVGLRLARDHPDRFPSLILSASPAGLDTPKNSELVATAAGSSERRRFASLPAFLALGESFRRAEPERTFLYDRISGRNPPRTGGAFGQIGASSGLIDPATLAGYRVPTLVIGGGDDRFLGAGFEREIAALIPGAEAIAFETVGHSPYYEMPERFNAVALGFIEACLATEAQAAASSRP